MVPGGRSHAIPVPYVAPRSLQNRRANLYAKAPLRPSGFNAYWLSKYAECEPGQKCSATIQ